MTYSLLGFTDIMSLLSLYGSFNGDSLHLAIISSILGEDT